LLVTKRVGIVTNVVPITAQRSHPSIATNIIMTFALTVRKRQQKRKERLGRLLSLLRLLRLLRLSLRLRQRSKICKIRTKRRSSVPKIYSVLILFGKENFQLTIKQSKEV